MTTVCRLVLFLSTLLIASGLVPGPAYAGVRPIIESAPVHDAPAGGRGGIMNAYVSCSRYMTEPRARMVITSARTGDARTFRWVGALPGMHFPRFAPGRYTVRTTAWCRGNRDVRTQTVRIREKTPRGTVSRSEFDRVRRGMTRSQVRAVIGNDGRDPFTYRGQTTRTYDMMAFWCWSIISYRDGRVVSKAWNTPHD